jgi:hypothetical protein
MERNTFKAVLVNPGYVSPNGNWTVVYRVVNATVEQVAKFKAFKGVNASKCVDIQEVNGQMVEQPLVWVDSNDGNTIELIQTTKGNFIKDDSAMRNAGAVIKKYPWLAGEIAKQATQHLNLFGNAKSVNITPVNVTEDANLNGF